jgi:hypothetical protein
MLRIPHCLDSPLTDGGKVVSLTHRPRSTPQKHFSVPGTHFYWRLSKRQGLMRLEGLSKLNSSGFELALTTTLPRAAEELVEKEIPRSEMNT